LLASTIAIEPSFPVLALRVNKDRQQTYSID
jgi:hypothetical protein